MPMRPAIVWAIRAGSPDAAIEKLPHRRRAHQGRERRCRKFAVLIVNAVDVDDHLALGFIVTDALNEAAPVDIPALERPEIDGAAISDVDRFGANLGGQKVQEHGCCRSDHGIHRNTP
jgi:hypothetical protein